MTKNHGQGNLCKIALNGGLVSEGESMTIMVGSMAASGMELAN